MMHVMHIDKSFVKKIIIIVLSVVFLILYLNGSKLRELLDRKIVSVDVLSESLIRDFTKNKKLMETAPRLTFNDAEIAYDSGTKTIYLPQNMSQDHWEGVLKASDETTEIYFRRDDRFKKPAEAIKDGYAFELYMISGDEYCIYRVIFTGMPTMSIITDLSAKEQVNDLGRTVYSGKVQVYDPYHTSTQFQVTECTFHIRGGSSEYYEKQNYKLNLTDKKLSFLGLRKDDDWILNSLYDDAGLVHNKLSFEMWQEIAASNSVANDEGVNAEYLELFVDNEYRGVYLLTERVDKKALSLGKNDILYKCRASRIPEEHNYSNENTDELRPIFVLEYPKEIKEEDWNPLKDWVNAFCKMQMDSYVEEEHYLNMENAIDYNLFLLLVCGEDNMRKNTYFIAEYQKDGSYQFKKVPWDLNATWGNAWIDDADCNYTIYEPNCVEDVNTWCTDISTLYYYDETRISELLMNRWKELRQENIISEENMIEKAEAQFEYLYDSGAYVRNYTRWPHGSGYWKDDYLFQYIKERVHFLDEYFERLYNETLTPAIYDGVDYSAEFESRFYWERYKIQLSEWYSYDRQKLLEHYVQYGKPYELHGRRSNEYPDDWEYMYGAKSEQ